MNTRPNFAYADNGGLPIAFAHRGGNLAGKAENTMAAFSAAHEAGYSYFETDVISTADGLVIAMHGAEDQKDQAKNGLPLISLLQSMPYDEICRTQKIGGKEIPLLEEVMRAFPEARFNIDPKSDEVVEPLSNLIWKLRARDRVGIGSFKHNRTKAVAEMLGGQERVWTSLGPLGFVALKYGLLPGYLSHTRAAGLQLPLDRGITERMVAYAHDLRLDVHVWTPNTKPEMVSALDNGVDGVMTDNIVALREVLEERGEWPLAA